MLSSPHCHIHSSPGVEMIGIQNNKARNCEKPFPGCLGRMVNLFDLNTGVAANKLLTEKPHCDGLSLSRSQSDVARVSSPIREPIEDKLIVSELRRTSSNKKSNGIELRRTSSNKKSNGTPMKMLIGHEMSKEVEAKHNPPNLVAKLMGLDALPQQQFDSVAQRSHSRSYSCNTLTQAGMPMECWQQEIDFLKKRMQCEVDQSSEQTEYKDVYEIWQQSQRSNSIRDKSLQKVRCNNDLYEKKMALVQQKFIEAKRLATDETLRQSKEFQEALEVLSSNKDLFIKFLQEPNSLCSQHLYEFDYIPPSPDTKRITVLRPSKMVDDNKVCRSGNKGENQIKKQSQEKKANEWHQNFHELSPTSADWRANDNPTQPTRIVVLKPSPQKTHEPPSLLPRTVNEENFCEEPEDDDVRESREVAKEITRQMRENLSGHRRDETLLSSVFSNGYAGDESSFNKSENEYAVEILSDSEVISPTSRHSWDYINRFGSPFSSSSFSRASHSPESSVCREAKKRLSERWAMMALNGHSQEQKHVRRSSSTLGEMLALSETKKSVNPEEEDVNKDQESRGMTTRLTCDLNKDGGGVDSPRDLLRSKSLPVSSTVNGARLNVQLAGPEVGKTSDSKELRKAESMKTSFKGKVSSLFFSRNNKSSKEKSGQSRSIDESQATTSETPVTPVHTSVEGGGVSQCVNDSSLERCSSSGLRASSRDSVSTGSKEGIVSHKAGLAVTKQATPANPCENQDQPSPISVLEPPFEEDGNTSPMFSGGAQLDNQGLKDSVHHIKSNLIDKSPPIESISRTLSWEDYSAETATSFPFKSSLASSGPKEAQDWPLLIQTLLSISGIDVEVNYESFIGRWHSPESPLDPLLREKYVNLDDKEFLQEARRRQQKSSRKLVFDCVNAALVDITGYGSETSHKAKPFSGAYNSLLEGGASPILVDRVWSWMKELFSDEARCVGGDGNSLVVERVVRKEVVGKMWTDRMTLETDNVEKEIEKKLLEELVEEAVVELTGWV